MDFGLDTCVLEPVVPTARQLQFCAQVIPKCADTCATPLDMANLKHALALSGFCFHHCMLFLSSLYLKLDRGCLQFLNVLSSPI